MTLYRAVIAVAGALLALLVAMALFGGVPFWPSAVMFGALLALILLERFRYKPLAATPPPGWSATGERFVDPESGRPVTVFADPISGERSYVAD